MQYLIVNQPALTKYGHNTLGYLEGNTVCIYREQLAVILNKLGFEDSQIIVKQWVASNDIVFSEKDRITTRKLAGGKKLISYKIRVPEEYIQAGLCNTSYNPMNPNKDKINQRLAKYSADSSDEFDVDF